MQWVGNETAGARRRLTLTMTTLTEICARVDGLLRIREIPDYPGAHNGLQLANRTGKVWRIYAAVDASLPVVEDAAARGGPALLLVHHGMFWNGVQPVVAGYFAKLAAAMDAGIAVYSAHLPLDVHPELGNNARLAAALGLANPTPFLEWKGIHTGLQAETDCDLEALVAKVAGVVEGPVHACPAGPDRVRRIGIVTGGAGSQVAAAAAAGVDTLLTGEGPHWSYTAAQELGINLLLAGHYATETFGVRALAAALSEEFNIPWSFLDHPTGL